MSELVGNPEDRFSHVAAELCYYIVTYTVIICWKNEVLKIGLQYQDTTPCLSKVLSPNYDDYTDNFTKKWILCCVFALQTMLLVYMDLLEKTCFRAFLTKSDANQLVESQKLEVSYSRRRGIALVSYMQRLGFLLHVSYVVGIWTFSRKFLLS